jgi:DNA-binding transcriptional LysR family regulator
MLDPSALEALEAVVDAGSVSAAAQRLNKAASAISYHLRRLEEQVGEPLFDRSGYRLALTRQGESILAEARPILQALRALSGMSKRFREGWEPVLRIVYDGALPTHGIVAALQQLEARNPPTWVELTVSFLGGVEREFDKRDADLLIAAAPTGRSDLVIRTLAPLGFTLCCAASHALAQLERVSLQNLRGATELIVSGPDDDPAYLSRHFGSHRVFRLSDFHTKRSAILEGLGFGWLPDFMATPLLHSGRLHRVAYVNGGRYQLVPFCAMRVGRPAGLACSNIVDSLLSQDWTT